MKFKLSWVSDNSDYKGRKKWFNGGLTEEHKFEDIVVNIKSLPDLMNFVREQDGTVIITEEHNEIIVFDGYYELTQRHKKK